MNCPCSPDKMYSHCCQPFIEGMINAPTAEKLMRSRYSAFTLANADYLMKSHHASTRPIKEKNSIKRWAESVQWMGLTILNSSGGSSNNQEGMVEFKALLIENGQLLAIHEKSLFRKEKGMWYYVSGEQF